MRPPAQRGDAPPARLFDREPPHSIEAEQATLGAMMLNNPEAAELAVQILGRDDGLFYAPQHQAIYEAALALMARREPVDFATVCDELQRAGQLDMVGGPSYVGSVGGVSPTSANIEHYARIVAGKARARRQVVMASLMHSAALEDDSDTFTAQFSQLDELQRRSGRGLQYEQFPDSWEQEALTPLPWLVPRWLLRRTVTVCAAEGGTGKSFLTLGVALATATGTEFFPGLHAIERAAVMIVDLENNRDTTIRRIHSYKQRYQMNGHMTTSMRERLHLVHDLGTFITPGPHGRGWVETPFFRQVLADARRIKPGLIVIDHLRKLAGDADGNDNTAMGEAMKRCDMLARESGAAVLVLAHTNKAAGQAGAGKANVRGAGSITDEARCVWELRRDEEHEGVLTLIRTKANFAPTMASPLAFRLVETGNDAACLESADLPTALQRQPGAPMLAKSLANWLADNRMFQVSVGSPQNSGGGKRLMEDFQRHWPSLKWSTVMSALKLARGKGLVHVLSLETQGGKSRQIWESLVPAGQPWAPEPDSTPSYTAPVGAPYEQDGLGFDGETAAPVSAPAQQTPAAPPTQPTPTPTNITPFARPASLSTPAPTAAPLFEPVYQEDEEDDPLMF